jgi:hypothetical protein
MRGVSFSCVAASERLKRAVFTYKHSRNMVHLAGIRKGLCTQNRYIRLFNGLGGHYDLFTTARYFERSRLIQQPRSRIGEALHDFKTVAPRASMILSAASYGSGTAAIAISSAITSRGIMFLAKLLSIKTPPTTEPIASHSRC